MIDVLHHWLAATVIPKPLTTAIPATHIPKPVEETRLARHHPEDEAVTPRKPRPPAAHAPTRRGAGHRGVNRLPSVRRRGSSHAKTGDA